MRGKGRAWPIWIVVPNPYRPGFNQPPVVLAGRDAVLEAAQDAIDGAALDGHHTAAAGPRWVAWRRQDGAAR